MLLASKGQLSLVGIIISTGGQWGSIADNLSGWTQMRTAALASGLASLPGLTASPSNLLVKPSDGILEHTTPNNSQGSQLIVNTARTTSAPLVVVTGGRLTDVADAYLQDPSIKDRIYVVSSLGSATQMGIPNGEMDPWADAIVAQRLRYIQVSVLYDQSADVTSALLAQLPSNPFVTWMQGKENQISGDNKAADQVALAAAAIQGFVAGPPATMAQNGVDANGQTLLASAPGGPITLVTQVNAKVLAARFQQMLLDPATFGAN